MVFSKKLSMYRLRWLRDYKYRQMSDVFAQLPIIDSPNLGIATRKTHRYNRMRHVS